VIRREGALVASDEVRKVTLDREAWRERIELMVTANKKVDSSKRETSKIRRVKTRSATVVM
jgi:hypothetical protein